MRNSGDNVGCDSIPSHSSVNFCGRSCVSPDFPNSEVINSTHAW